MDLQKQLYLCLHRRPDREAPFQALCSVCPVLTSRALPDPVLDACPPRHCFHSEQGQGSEVRLRGQGRHGNSTHVLGAQVCTLAAGRRWLLLLRPLAVCRLQ